MKSILPVVLVFTLLSTHLRGQEEDTHQEEAAQEHKPHTLEKEDQKLLLIFSSIVSCFANILKDPHNPQILALNLSGIATGVINMLLNTLECKTSSELNQHIEQLRTITRTIKPVMSEQELS